MKPRARLTALEVNELIETLNRRLDRVGLETQPVVAAKILKLIADPGAGLAEYAKIIRVDAALTGRLLRITNSAFFAQRQPVTTIDRACVLLGIERLKSFSLGFYLSHAAAGDRSAVLSRRIWGQSVFRACLCAELVRKGFSQLAPEAFIVGLMVDAGIPLMGRLLGQAYYDIALTQSSPGKLHRIELDTMEFTHVDVAVALMRRWRVPELLAQPIVWHHTAPSESAAEEPVTRLHRAAYYVGSVSLHSETAQPTELAPQAAVADATLGLNAADLSNAVSRAAAEYQATSGLFSDIADTIADMESLARAVQTQLVQVIDDTLLRSFGPIPTSPPKFRLGGFNIELETEPGGSVVAYCNDSRGLRLVSYRFSPSSETPESIRAGLGIDPQDDDEIAGLGEYLRTRAA